jgi:hypothetical protein|tara:strand:- start:2226 stop:2624 length:399 start_codon:yes stop_codon:yes gene_type:complete
MVRRGGMRTQMARQMGVSKNKADDLLAKAKKMNDAEGFNKGGSSMAKKFPDLTGDGKTTYADVLKGRGAFAGGGSMTIIIGANVSRETFNPVEEITPGPKDIKVEMNRQVRNQEIKGTPPVQVKGRKFSGVY